MRKLILIKVIFIVIFIVFAPFLSYSDVHNPVSRTWTNNAGGEWSRDSNWDPEGVPDSDDSVFIVSNGGLQDFTVTMDIAAGITIMSLTMTKGTNDKHTLNLQGNIYITDMLTVNENETVSINSRVITIGKDISGAGNIFSSAEGELRMIGVENNLSIPNCFANIRIAGNGISLSGNTSCRNFTIDAGSSFQLGAILYVKGNMDINGEYNKGSGSLIFNSGTLQSVFNNGNQDLGKVQLLTSGTIVSLLSSSKFTSLSISSGTVFKNSSEESLDITMTTAENGGISVNKGSFVLNGMADKYVTLQAESDKFDLTAVSGSTVSLSYVSLENCDASKGMEINATNNCTDLGGNINVDFYAPAGIKDLQADTGEGTGEIILRWTATGDDGDDGTSSSYIIKYSGAEIKTESEFNSATTYVQNWTPKESGETEEQTLTGLIPTFAYYINIKAVDNSGGTGPSSDTSPNANAGVGDDAKLWNNPSGGNWGDNGNWSPAGVPDESHRVYILDQGGSGEINIEISGDTTINFLTMVQGAGGETHRLVLNGNLDVLGDISMSGSEKIYLQDYILTARGNVSSESAEITSGTGELRLEGSSPQNLHAPNCSANIVIAYDGVFLTGNTKAKNFVMDIHGALNIGSYNLTIEGDMSISGGNFYKGSGSLIFNSGGIQSISSIENQDLGNVKTTVSGTTVSLSNTLQFTSLTIESGTAFEAHAGGITIAIDDASGITVNNGTFILSRTSGSNITLKSDSSGNAFDLVSSSASSVTLNYVSIKDCNASVEINAQNNCTDLGGNVNIDWFTPSAVTNLSASSGEGIGNIILTWSAVGDDTTSGIASGYAVKYSSSPITTSAQFDSASAYTQSWSPVVSGNSENKTLTGLAGGIIYYISIKAVDNVGGTGGLSNTTGNSVQTNSGKTWATTTGNWNTAGNWSPAGVPAAIDFVIIPSSAEDSIITMNIAGGTTIASLTMEGVSGKTHTLALAGNLCTKWALSISSLEAISLGSCTVLVHGNVSASGSLSSSTGELNIGGTAAQNLLTSNCSANIRISNISAPVSLSGNSSSKDFVIGTGSVFNQGSSNLIISGNLTAMGTYTKGTGTLTFNKGGLQSATVTSSQNLGNVRLSNSYTTLNLLSNAGISSLIIDSGTNFRNIIPGTTISMDTGGNISVGGVFTLVGNGWGVSTVVLRRLSSGNFTINPAGTLSLTYVSLSGCSAVSGSPLNLSDKTVNNLGNNANIIFPPRSWNYGNIDNWINISRWYPPAVPDASDNVIINTTNSVVTGASGSVNSLVIGSSFSSILSNSVPSTLTVLGALTVGSSGNITNSNLNVKGNFTSSKVSLMINNLTLSGSSAQTVSLPNSFVLGVLRITNTSSTVALNNSAGTILYCKGITADYGSSLQINSQTISITGDATFAGSVLFSSSAPTLIFCKEPGLQSLSAGNNNLGKILIQVDSSPNTLNVLDSIKFHSLTVGANSTFRLFSAGRTVSVDSAGGISVLTDAGFYLAGSYDDRASFKSLVDGQTFRFTLDSAGIAKFAYVDIYDCNANSGTALYIPYNCTQNTKCYNIEFSPTVNNKTWIGAASTDWFTDNNWSSTGKPIFFDDVIIPEGSTITQNQSGTASIASLSFNGISSTSVNYIAVNGDCSIDSGNILTVGNLIIKGNLSAPNVLGQGVLFLSGKTFQSVSWQGESWDFRVFNTDAEITASGEVKCKDFILSANTRYNQGGNNLTVLGYMRLYDNSSFSSSSAANISVGDYLRFNPGTSGNFGGSLYVTNYLTSDGACSLGNGRTRVDGNLTLNTNGILTQGSASLIIGGTVLFNGTFNQGSGDMYIYGNLLSIGASEFNKGTGITKFLKEEGGLQVLNASSNDLGRVEVMSSNTLLSLNNSVKFSSLLLNNSTTLLCKIPDKVIDLGNATIEGTLDLSASRITLLVQPKPDIGITISAAGRLKFVGTSGTSNYVVLLSAQNGSQFNFTTASTENVSIRYAKLRDCDASSGSQIEGVACLDLGNNLNVFFGAQPPSSINNLKIRQNVGSGNVQLNWTAVGTEENRGRAASYIVKYSPVNITTQEQFDSAFTYNQNWVPQITGSSENYTLTGLPQSTDIWFASVEAKNFADLQGDVSRITEFKVILNPSRTVSYSLPGERGNINIEIPAGAFTQNVEITGKELSESQMPLVNQPEFKGTGLGASFSIYPEEKFKQPLKLKIKYDSKDITGLNADKLKIAFYNDTMGKWFHIKSNVDSNKKTVSGELKHLTTFRIVEYTYLGLSTVKVFPNPWKIGTAGNFDNGELTFKNLPEKGRIRIYNVAGEMVKDISITDADGGFYSWNGTNDAGNKVSSNVYIAYIQDEEGNHRIIKVAVIR